MVSVVGLVALVALGLSIFGVWGWAGWMSTKPAEFRTCAAAPPRQNEPVVRLGNCYSSAPPPPHLNNDTIFCGTPAPGETLRWNGTCVDTYPPAVLTSLGSPSVLVNETTLRGVGATGLATAAETPTNIVIDVPQPSSAGGLSLIADPVANVFLGLDATGELQLDVGSGTAIITGLAWTTDRVDGTGLENVDAFIGGSLFYRQYVAYNREHGEARGSVSVQYTNSDRTTIMQLALRMVMPIGLGTPTWIGPGAVGCALKALEIGSVATPIYAAAAFSRNDGFPYLYFYVPPTYGGGTVVECSFEMGYMVEL